MKNMGNNSYNMDIRNAYLGKYNACGLQLKIALFCVAWTYLIDLAYTGCASSLPENKVAHMCIDSEAIGSTIYIDTTNAKATDNSSGPLCVCNATISDAKFVKVRVQEKISSCGSKLKFGFTGKILESDENLCRATKEFVQIENQQEMSLSLEKIKEPFSVDFCTKIEIEVCSDPDDYQCDTTAQCISKTSICDNVPDCPDNDDEGRDKCPSVFCSEELLPCKNRVQCFSASERCDNVSKCDDGTDEEECFLGQNVFETSTKVIVQRTDPMISMKCYESTRIRTSTPFAATTTTTLPTTQYKTTTKTQTTTSTTIPSTKTTTTPTTTKTMSTITINAAPTTSPTTLQTAVTTQSNDTLVTLPNTTKMTRGPVTIISKTSSSPIASTLIPPTTASTHLSTTTSTIRPMTNITTPPMTTGSTQSNLTTTTPPSSVSTDHSITTSTTTYTTQCKSKTKTLSMTITSTKSLTTTVTPPMSKAMTTTTKTTASMTIPNIISTTITKKPAITMEKTNIAITKATKKSLSRIFSRITYTKYVMTGDDTFNNMELTTQPNIKHITADTPKGDNDDDEDNLSSLKKEYVAGIIVGVLGIAVAICLISAMRRKKKKSDSNNLPVSNDLWISGRYTCAFTELEPLNT